MDFLKLIKQVLLSTIGAQCPVYLNKSQIFRPYQPDVTDDEHQQQRQKIISAVSTMAASLSFNPPTSTPNSLLGSAFQQPTPPPTGSLQVTIRNLII